MGGDEFGVLLKGYDSPMALMATGKELCDDLNRPFILNGVTVQVSASLGFATYPTVARSPNGLFERADFALYHAKRTHVVRPFSLRPIMKH